MKTIHNRFWLIYLLLAGVYKSTSAQTTQSTTYTNSSSIYIITSFNYQNVTSDTTAYTVQTSQVTSDSSTPTMTTNYTGIFIITNYTTVTTTFQTSSSTSTTSPTTTTTTSTTTPLGICNNGTHITLSNGTCVSRAAIQITTVNLLYSNSSNDTDKTNALSLYITSVTNSSVSLNSSYTLTVDQIDGLLGNLSNANYTVNTNNSIIVITQLRGVPDNKTVIGASFQEATGVGTVVNTINRDNVTNSDLTGAGIVTLDTLRGVTSFNILVMNDPTIFRNQDTTSNRVLASSMVFATINRNTTDQMKLNIELYFQVLYPPAPTVNAKYLCTFFNSNISQWDDSGCSVPVYNTIFQRYECNCSHLTSFALIWAPTRPSTSFVPNTPAVYDAQDKASIAFQAISITCFLLIVTHGIIVRVMNPQQYTEPRNLLPLVSCGITMLLFVFYIALGATVYSRFSQSNGTTDNPGQQGKTTEDNYGGRNLDARADFSSTASPIMHTRCLPQELALMFIVYFFIIFMFCSKTSVGYYNYRHFVLLFPAPSRRNLLVAICISALISLIWMIFGIGFNSRPTHEITEVFAGKLCWFNSSVIHYFLTIPIVIFLVVNLTIFILVGRKIIKHAGKAETNRSRYIRRRNCVIVLLSSSITQGLGWIFGILTVVDNQTSVKVFGWLFVIFNGLEGFWAILLYLVVRNENLDKTERYRDDIDRQVTRDNDYNIQPVSSDDQRFDIRSRPLKTLQSDSPRGSFIALDKIKISHYINPD